MSWEVSIIEYVGNLRGPFLDRAMIFITDLGSTAFALSLGAILALVFLLLKKYHYAAMILVMLGGEKVIVSFIKHLFARARPEVLPHLALSDGFSFPSGHSATATLFFGFLAYLLAKHFQNKPAKILIWAIASGIIFLVGFSRVYLGVHWPSDVLGGYLLAFLWLSLVIFVFEKKFGENKS